MIICFNNSVDNNNYLIPNDIYHLYFFAGDKWTLLKAFEKS